MISATSAVDQYDDPVTAGEQARGSFLWYLIHDCGHTMKRMMTPPGRGHAIMQPAVAL